MRRWAGDVRMVFRVEAVGSGLGHKPGGTEDLNDLRTFSLICVRTWLGRVEA
jgi:hypothetical protein